MTIFATDFEECKRKRISALEKRKAQAAMRRAYIRRPRPEFLDWIIWDDSTAARRKLSGFAGVFQNSTNVWDSWPNDRIRKEKSENLSKKSVMPKKEVQLPETPFSVTNNRGLPFALVTPMPALDPMSKNQFNESSDEESYEPDEADILDSLL